MSDSPWTVRDSQDRPSGIRDYSRGLLCFLPSLDYKGMSGMQYGADCMSDGPWTFGYIDGPWTVGDMGLTACLTVPGRSAECLTIRDTVTYF